MNKTLKHIKAFTENVEADAIKEVYLTSTKQIRVIYELDGDKWTGDIQKIYLDKNGEAISYDVYIY